jgi:hypothetical protein
VDSLFPRRPATGERGNAGSPLRVGFPASGPKLNRPGVECVDGKGEISMSTDPELEALQAKRTQMKAFSSWKSFLESTPANTPAKIDVLATERGTVHNKWWEVPCPSLELHCPQDDGTRYFDCSDKTAQIGYRFLSYTCRNCRSFHKTIAVLIYLQDPKTGKVEVMKLGEYPPFAAPISKRVEKLLEKNDLELYRKGTRAEAQGLGIGAAGYFRRIVDEQWKLLVTEIRDAAAELGVRDLSVFEAALRQTQFSTAVDMLKDAIPPKLLILGGENPLTLLYKPLSVQIHTLTDEECMQQAQDIRTVLTALLENIGDVLKDQDELKNAVNRLKQIKS